MCDINISEQTGVSGQEGAGCARAQGQSVSASWDDLALPEVAPQCVEVINAFYRMRSLLEIAFGESRVRLGASWPSPGERCDAENDYAIALRIDNIQGEIRLSRALLERLFLGLDQTLSLERLREDHAAIVLEFALSAALEHLESTFGWRIVIESVAPIKAANEASNRPALYFMVDGLGSGVSWLDLRLAPATAMAFGRYLDQRFAIPPTQFDLPVGVRLRVAATTLPLSEVRRLAPGDIVIADSACEQEEQAVAVFASHLAAPVMMTADGVQFLGRPQPGRGSSLEWSLDRAVEESSEEISRLDDLPVHLVYEIGRWDSSLGDLRQIRAGSVAPLAQSSRNVVGVVANGKRIGQGTPVRIGESFGVKITRLFERD